MKNIEYNMQALNAQLDLQSPPKIRCVQCIVGKQKLFVKEEYLG